MLMKFTVFDLFSGVGALSYGFSQLKEFEILAANEIDKDIATAYKLNHPTTEMLNCDIKNLTEDALLKAINGRSVDVVIGGPPCQSYSTLGKRQLDERANLFMQYKRILEILQPKVFVYENVTGLLTIDKGKLFIKLQCEFEELGYRLKYRVLNAADYGVPQHRERVVLVGVKGENDFLFPKATHGEGLKPYVTFGDALLDLPSLKPGETKNFYTTEPTNNFLKFVRKSTSKTLEGHSAPKHNDKVIKIMKTLKEGESKLDLPDEIRPKSGYDNTYAKLWWDKPSTTITRNFACPSSTRCIHPTESRALTIREGARLQSFPDDYVFYGSNQKKRLEIGNAVPPLLSIALAKQVLKVLVNY